MRELADRMAGLGGYHLLLVGALILATCVAVHRRRKPPLGVMAFLWLTINPRAESTSGAPDVDAAASTEARRIIVGLVLASFVVVAIAASQ